MDDLRKELLGESKRLTTPRININKKYLIIVIAFLVFGWYIGILLFGTNSIIRLNQLESELQTLQSQVQQKKQENARMQKDLFEILQIRGEN